MPKIRIKEWNEIFENKWGDLEFSTCMFLRENKDKCNKEYDIEKIELDDENDLIIQDTILKDIFNKNYIPKEMFEIIEDAIPSHCKDEKIDFKYYQELCKLTQKQCSERELLIICGLGISGESGEVTDYIKKIVIHNHEMDKNIIIKEIGDICWYIATLCNTLNIDFEEILKINIQKLKDRYPNGFDSNKSINRKGE